MRVLEANEVQAMSNHELVSRYLDIQAQIKALEDAREALRVEMVTRLERGEIVRNKHGREAKLVTRTFKVYSVSYIIEHYPQFAESVLKAIPAQVQAYKFNVPCSEAFTVALVVK